MIMAVAAERINVLANQLVDELDGNAFCVAKDR